MAFGQGSVNDDRLNEEGEWGCGELVSRNIIDTQNVTISIPDAKIRGAQSLIHLSYMDPGNKIPHCEFCKN